MRKIKSFITRVWILIFCLCVLSGCIKEWGLSIIDVGDTGPIFCFSSNHKCDEKGEEIHSIYIDEIDKKGNSIKMAWLLHGNSNDQVDYIINKVEYGKPPHGWKEKEHANPIKNNTYYSVNGEYFFMRDENGQYRLETRKEFFEKIHFLK